MGVPSGRSLPVPAPSRRPLPHRDVAHFFVFFFLSTGKHCSRSSRRLCQPPPSPPAAATVAGAAVLLPGLSLSSGRRHSTGAIDDAAEPTPNRDYTHPWPTPPPFHQPTADLDSQCVLLSLIDCVLSPFGILTVGYFFFSLFLHWEIASSTKPLDRPRRLLPPKPDLLSGSSGRSLLATAYSPARISAPSGASWCPEKPWLPSNGCKSPGSTTVRTTNTPPSLSPNPVPDIPPSTTNRHGQMRKRASTSRSRRPSRRRPTRRGPPRASSAARSSTARPRSSPRAGSG